LNKVLHIIDSMAVGGAEKLLAAVIPALSMFENHLILLGQEDTLLKDIPAYACKVTKLDFKSYKDVLRIAKKVRKYIKENNIDIVHSQLYWSHIVARLAAKKKVSVFNTMQAINSKASYEVNKITLYLDKLTYKKRHHIIGVSDEVLTDFDKWVGLKGASTVVYNIIDDKFFAPNSKTHFSTDGLRLVAVGNLRWQKNYPFLIEAFKKMPPEISLDIYGEGNLRTELQQIIDEYSLNIRLCGQKNNLHEILPAYDIFIMSSLYEGFSLGLMEAMACGLPCFLSDIPVLRQAARENAVYFSLDNTEDLVNKIGLALNKETSLEAMSSASFVRANEVARKETYVQRIKQLYENSL
jgi:glycosyltransferase involved in cell wall biosynthesis